MRGHTLIETLVVAAIAAAIIALSLAMIGSHAQQQRMAAPVNEVKRRLAIDAMYGQRAITGDEIWLHAARSELMRRNMVGPADLNRQTLALYLDMTGPHDPPFVVPDRYAPQTLEAMGLSEPELGQ